MRARVSVLSSLNASSRKLFSRRASPSVPPHCWPEFPPFKMMESRAAIHSRVAVPIHQCAAARARLVGNSGGLFATCQDRCAPVAAKHQQHRVNDVWLTDLRGRCAYRPARASERTSARSRIKGVIARAIKTRPPRAIPSIVSRKPLARHDRAKTPVRNRNRRWRIPSNVRARGIRDGGTRRLMRGRAIDND